MRGWRVTAKSVQGRVWLEKYYGRPGRGDRAVAVIGKVSDDPLSYSALRRTGVIKKFGDAFASEIVEVVFKSFAKANGVGVDEVKKHLEVEIL